MEKHYYLAKHISLWHQLKKQWKRLYQKLQSKQLKNPHYYLGKLNRLSLQLGIKKRVALSALAGFITLGAQAQLNFIRPDRADQVFPEPIDIGSLATPFFIDLDGDNDPDLVSGSSSGVFHYFQNNNGGFDIKTGSENPFDGIDIGSTSAPTFADLDGDDDPDLISGNSNGMFHYFENEGGIFTEQTGQDNPLDGLDVGDRSIPLFLDFDGDDDLDLISGDDNGMFHYFENEGGVFTEQFGQDNPLDNIDIGSRSIPFSIDFDEDDDLDLISGGSDGSIHYFENDNGTLTEIAGITNPFNTLNGGNEAAPTLQDIDDDGDIDLIVGTSTGTFAYFENENNFFTQQTGTDNPFDGFSGAGGRPTFIDFDEDNDFDLFTSNAGFFKYFQNINGKFVAQDGALNPLQGLYAVGFLYGIDYTYDSSPAFADLDDDGDLDMISGEYEGAFTYFENIGGVFIRGTLPTLTGFNSNPGGYHSTPTFVDLDGDDDIDMVSGNGDGTFILYENENGSFTRNPPNNPLSNLSLSNDFSVYTSAPAFADLDNDGDPDLVSGNGDGTFQYFENIDGIFEEKTGSENPFDGFSVGSISRNSRPNSAPTFVDLDGDGDLDLVSGRGNGNTLVEFHNVSSILTSVSSSSQSSKNINLQLYPNPASTSININAEGNYEIMNTTGALIIKGSINNNLIDISSLSQGFYQLRIDNGQIASFVKEQ